ncbi:MAG: EamA family transporter [Treponema sp.]|nr:EamA family transporter [Treponema sp.]
MKYILSTVLAGILWGIISIFVRTLSAAGLTSVQIMFLRGGVSAVLLLVFLLIKDRSLLKIHLRDLWMFLGTGLVSLTFFSLCYFTTILQAGTSIAVILLYTSPIFILVFSRFLFKEKITGVKIAALVMTFAGCILVSGLGSGHGLSARAFFIGLCAGFGYAMYSIFGRYALAKYNSLTVNFYTFVFSSISILPFCHAGQIVPVLNTKVIFFILGIAIFCTILPYFFYTYGLSGLETGKAAIFVTVEPLVGTLIGFFVWKEQATIMNVAGILLILAAIVALGLLQKNQNENQTDN